MTIQQLIDELQKCKNKDEEIYVESIKQQWSVWEEGYVYSSVSLNVGKVVEKNGITVMECK